MPLKPHPTDPDKMVFVKSEYSLPKEWVGLTKEECFELCVKHKDAPFSLLLAVQDKLKEKNGY